MKTKSRNVLQQFGGLMLGVLLLTGNSTLEARATGLEELAGLNAGAAEVLDVIDYASGDEAVQNVGTEEAGTEEVETEDVTTEENTASDTETEEADAGETQAEEYNLVMADVKGSMNVRQEPTTDSAKVGLLYADCGATILERGDGWTKIQSGNLIGWACNDYLVFGEEAQQMAAQVGSYQATIHVDGLRIRQEPNTESAVWAQAADGDVYDAVNEYTTNEWVAIEYDGALGYVSAEYVTVEFTVDHGETLEEIQERERQERIEQQLQIVEEGASAIGTTDDVLLAALIQCEAANQPYEGQVAVGAVVINRVLSSSYPDTIAGVIYASGQFTPAVTGKIETLAVNGVKESCLQAAQAAINGENPVGTATHFRRAGNRDGLVIGDHVFY
jgi:uncharacterized protein YgiM (DUF1202 family)